MKKTPTKHKTTATSPLPTYKCEHCKTSHAPWVKQCIYKVLGR